MLPIIGLVLLSVLIATSAAQSGEQTSYLLPKTSVPYHYDLNLKVYLGDVFKYEGNVNINITVLEETNSLVLHSEDTKIDVSRSYVYSSQGVIKILSASGNAENHFVTFKLEKQLTPGDYAIKIFFSGNYNTFQKGLFLSSYNLPNGEKKYLVATHLQPINARSIFPCYDEPNLKATFKVTVDHPSTYHAISNSPVESISSAGNIKTTKFETTERMSTYLLAIAVSDFETQERQYRGKPVRLFVKPGEVINTDFSLNISLQALYNFEKLLGVKYTLPKLDGIAVPSFGGAMENWGLIVYGNFVIVKNSSENTHTTVNLLCHEIAHQWFGNLVTLDWWDYVWLNEGFATYYAQRIGDMILPSERFMYSYYVSIILPLRYSDSLRSATDFLNRHVEKPVELGSKFNNFSYNKGAVIIRLMSLIFKNFDYAITRYLQNYSFKNTVPKNLFKMIDEGTPLSIGASVEKIMKSWVSNPGYPLITLNITDGVPRQVEITQERFSLDGIKLPEKWWIPITLTSEENPYFENMHTDFWMRDEDDSVVTYLKDANGWIIANLQLVVHCRVNYDIENWRRIIAYLKGPNFKKIHVLNRIQLIDDASNLAKAQRLPEKISLDLMTYLKQEDDELVLKAAEGSLVTYAELLKDTPIYPKYEKFVRDILGNTESSHLLRNAKFEDLIADAIFYSPKGYKDSEVVYRIIENIYSETEFSEVQKAFLDFVKHKRIPYSEYKPLMDELLDRFTSQLAVKERFLKFNYRDVEKWLTSNY